ncbi:MAG: condensation domain-containing protein, partial [Acidobacteriota bacterium]
FELGGDSILSIQIVARAGRAGLSLTARQVFERQTIAQLAAVATLSQAAPAQQAAVQGEVPLTPVQRWFFEQQFPASHHFNQTLLFEVGRQLSPTLLEEAAGALIDHHDALRLRFWQQGGAWRQFNAVGEENRIFGLIDLAGLPAGRRSAAQQEACAVLQGSLDLHSGPLLRIAFFERGPEAPPHLLAAVHHLSVDAVSWRILLEDLEAACRQLLSGQPIELPPKTTSFQSWAELLENHARQEALQSEAGYWLEERRLEAARLPLDLQEGANTNASVQQLSVSLAKQRTRALLKEVPAAYRTGIDDLLLAALALALSDWAGGGPWLVDLEGHGREELFEEADLSRTVGWFTSIYPVLLDVQGLEGEGAVIKAVKEQLRSPPDKGIGYGLLRYLSKDRRAAARLQEMVPAEVSFNYLGQLDRALQRDGLFQAAAESAGPASQPSTPRTHLLEVTGRVSGGRLRLEFAFSSNRHRRATIERLGRSYLQILQGLISHCCSPQAGGCTPSDFPLARLAQPELDRLLEQGLQIEDLYPLAPLQQGMLFHTLLQPHRSEYLIQTTWLLNRRLDVSAFQKAWQRTLERQPILRTAFLWKGLKEPLQVVQGGVEPEWKLDDWRGLTEDEQQRRLQELLLEDRKRGIDLSEVPLMRFALIRLSQQTHRFIWTSHHILMDGWSVPLILKDVFQFYRSLTEKLDPVLETVPQFKEHIAWLQNQDISAARDFWKRWLEGFETPTLLGLDKPLHSQDEGTLLPLDRITSLSEPASRALREMASRHQLTLNSVAQGAWALLLSRYSGDRDVVFGIVVSGRAAEIEGVESMAGLLINNLPMRVQVEPDRPLSEWLELIQK